MSHCAIPCVNKVDIGVVFVCYICNIPMSAIVYACCCLMLNNMHPGQEHDHETCVLYGCIKCCIGFVTTAQPDGFLPNLGATDPKRPPRRRSRSSSLPLHRGPGQCSELHSGVTGPESSTSR